MFKIIIIRSWLKKFSFNMKLSLLMSKKSLSAEFQKTLIYIRFKSSRLKFTYKPSIKLSSSLSSNGFNLTLICRSFSKFQFPGYELDRFLENSSIIFYLFSFCKISEHELDWIWMSFPEIGLCHAPEFIKNYFSTICSVLDRPVIGPCHAPKF